MARLTVTLPTALVEQIDLLERNRSRFIVEAVAHELIRRRRDALLLASTKPRSGEVGHNLGTIEADRGSRLKASL